MREEESLNGGLTTACALGVGHQCLHHHFLHLWGGQLLKMLGRLLKDGPDHQAGTQRQHLPGVLWITGVSKAPPEMLQNLQQWRSCVSLCTDMPQHILSMATLKTRLY